MRRIHYNEQTQEMISHERPDHLSLTNLLSSHMIKNPNLGWIPGKFKNFIFLSPNSHFRGKIIKMITKANFQIFMNLMKIRSFDKPENIWCRFCENNEKKIGFLGAKKRHLTKNFVSWLSSDSRRIPSLIKSKAKVLIGWKSDFSNNSINSAKGNLTSFGTYYRRYS